VWLWPSYEFCTFSNVQGTGITNGHSDICYGFVNIAQAATARAVGRSMPVEHDDDLFPLVLCCSISRLQLTTEKPFPLLSLFQALSMGTPSPLGGWPLTPRPFNYCGHVAPAQVNAMSTHGLGGRRWMCAALVKEFCLCSVLSSQLMSGVRRLSVDTSSRVSRENIRA